MKKIGGIFCVVASAFLAVYGASAVAQGVEEVEPNYLMGQPDPMSAAQRLTIGSDGTVTVNGFLEAGEAGKFGVDVFSFHARTASADHPEADLVTVDINGGIKSGAGSVDTFLAIHGPAPDYKALSWNSDRSSDDWDAYISNYRIDKDGVYYVIVTGGENRVADGGAGIIDGGNRESGTYTLIISGVSPAATPAPTPVPDPIPDPVKPISIEIKPGPGVVMARMNPNASARIPVALLSSHGFNALEIDESSLTFGHSGDENSLDRCDKRGRDVNGDGLLDKVCHFNNQAAKFEPTDDKAILKGKIAGKLFEGNGMLKVIPEKRRGRR